MFLSLDGVSETKSTSISLEVYTIKFDGCRDVYPVKILRPIKKEAVNHHEHFRTVLDAISEENLIIKCVVADNPKRAFMRDSLQHSAKFAYEYCFECGVPYSQTHAGPSSEILKKIQQQKSEIIEQISALDENTDSVKIQSLNYLVQSLEAAEKIAKKDRPPSNIVWPANTFNGEKRTKEKILAIVEKLEAGENLTHSERKGIKGRSLLLDLDYFDYVNCMPTEYMHLLSLGVVKRMLELTFTVGETRSRNTKRPLTPAHFFDDLIKNTKVPHEFPRRLRTLDLSVLKAQELRNICLFFFPFITQCLEGNEKEIKLWEMLAFMARACVIPEEEFSSVNVNSIKYCQKTFYTMYQQLFGEKNCVYSIHVFLSHLLSMRTQGPLTESSAFIFESFYAELRNSFQPGTCSVLKQMMEKVILKRILSHHVCSESLYFRVKDTALECNSLIYVYESNAHTIYKIKSIHENENQFICNRLGNHAVELPTTNMLNWSSVGFYRKGGLSSLNIIVPKENVSGKVLKVGKYLITCPANILREK